ncbi:MAG: SIS domain-containing protein [Lachnospiraceae bacterium]
MIKLIVADIDGVLTDGKIYIAKGEEQQKTISLKDLDAIAQIRKHQIMFGIITGEKNTFTEYIHERLEPDYWYDACKTKKQMLEKLAHQLEITPESICYIGDGKYDIEAMQYVGLSLCPADAIADVKSVADVILSTEGGNGCLAECIHMIEKYNDGITQVHTKLTHSLMEHNQLIARVRMDITLQHAIQKVIELMYTTFQEGGQVLFCGNGGSAADAQHLATELVSRFYFDRPALNAEALTVNTSCLTAIGNDYAFDRVFARQVEAKGKAKDVLIAISTSGTSKNIVEAIKAARDKKMKTVAMIGGDINCVMTQQADIVISVPSLNTPRIQEMHIMIGHIICECVEHEMYKRNER